jgi:hypothetical protein
MISGKPFHGRPMTLAIHGDVTIASLGNRRRFAYPNRTGFMLARPTVAAAVQGFTTPTSAGGVPLSIPSSAQPISDSDRIFAAKVTGCLETDLPRLPAVC